MRAWYGSLPAATSLRSLSRNRYSFSRLPYLKLTSSR